MSDQPTLYRIERTKRARDNAVTEKGWSYAYMTSDGERAYTEGFGVLTVVEPCEHGNYSPHVVSVRPDKVVCDGTPKAGDGVA